MLGLLFFLIGSIFDAAIDKLSFHYDRSVFYNFRNQQYWNPKFSSNNKWKEGRKANGEAFWGSSRWFVFLTDGWHLMQFFQLWFYAAAGVAGIHFFSSQVWWAIVLELIVARLLGSTVFSLFFDIVLVRKL